MKSACRYCTDGVICLGGELHYQGFLPVMPISPCPNCNPESYSRFVHDNNSAEERINAMQALQTHFIDAWSTGHQRWDALTNSAMHTTLKIHPSYSRLANELKTLFPELIDWPEPALVLAYSEFLLHLKNTRISDHVPSRDIAFLGYVVLADGVGAAPSEEAARAAVFELYQKNPGNLKRLHTEASPIERRYRMIVETVNEGIVESDANAVLTYVNPKICVMLGYHQNEMIGRSMFEFMPSEQIATTQNYLAQRREGIIDRYEGKLRHRDGNLIAVMISANPIPTAGNEYIGAVAIVTDMREAQRLREQVETARDDAIRSSEEKRKLIQQVNSAVEEERKNIAHELHDQLNASLIVARLESRRIVELATKQVASETGAEIQQKALSIIRITSDLYALCRKIVKRLRPEVLETLGLKGALEEMTQHYDGIHPTCRFSFTAPDQLQIFRDDLAITAYRLVQEAISNIVKHADASEATIELSIKNVSSLCIVINDNGTGFDPRTVSGNGLIGMRERVSGIGGTMKISTALGSGTTLSFDLPLILKE